MKPQSRRPFESFQFTDKDRLTIELPPGQRAGPYEILELIESGGIGSVYRGRHTGAGHIVAVKVFPRHVDVSSIEKEIDLLSRLNHPGFAALHGCGSIDVDGSHHPYIALEYVSGGTLLQNQENLSEEEALDRLETVFIAIDAAHQAGIVHRDLKPGNILIDPATQQPKVIDLGLSDLVSGDDLPTSLGWTRRYAPPEAFGGKTDERTDVYALGFIALEFLSRQRLTREANGEIRACKSPRALDSDSLLVKVPIVRRQLFCVLSKAASLEPSERYRNAGHLLRDFRNARRGMMTEASSTRRLDRIAFPVYRNARRLTACTAIVLMLALIAAFAWSRHSYAIQLREAEVELDTYADSYAELYERAAPSGEFGRDHDSTLIDEVSRIPLPGSSVSGIGERELEILIKRSEAFIASGRHTDAIRELLDAKTRTQQHGASPTSPALLHTDRLLAGALIDTGHFVRAKKILRRTLPEHTELFGNMDRRTLTVHHLEVQLDIKLGHFEDAIESLQPLVEFATESWGRIDKDTIAFRNSLANALSLAGDHNRALRIYEVLVEASRELHGELAPETLTARNNLAVAHLQAGNDEQAAHLYHLVIQDANVKLGASHPDTLLFHLNLCRQYVSHRQFEKAHIIALKCTQHCLDLKQSHPVRIRVDAAHAVVRTKLGHKDEFTRDLHESVVERRTRMLGTEHHLTVSAISNHAEFLVATGDYEQAIERYEHAIQISRNTLGPDHTDTLITQGCLAAAYTKLKRYQMAWQVYERVLDTSRRTLGATHTKTLAFERNAAVVSFMLGEHAVAVELFQKLANNRLDRYGPDHELSQKSTGDLVTAFLRLGRFDEARDVLERYVEVCHERLGEADPATQWAENRLKGVGQAERDASGDPSATPKRVSTSGATSTVG